MRNKTPAREAVLQDVYPACGAGNTKTPPKVRGVFVFLPEGPTAATQ
jgi:hypothetical protein